MGSAPIEGRVDRSESDVVEDGHRDGHQSDDYGGQSAHNCIAGPQMGCGGAGHQHCAADGGDETVHGPDETCDQADRTLGLNASDRASGGC